MLTVNHIMHMENKSFTLTHPSPLRPQVVSEQFLKEPSADEDECERIGGLQDWNIAKTHGKTIATAKTSTYTSCSKEKNCPSANNAGPT
jgi:hypothetical protein